MTIDNMPLSATQTHAECGVDARTIDDTREGIERNERASVGVKRSGGYERVQNDWYVEPESVTSRLLAVERPFIGGVHDPCCGQGSVGRALERHGVRHTRYSDVVPHDYCDSVGCFTRELPRWRMASVISNPPYNRAQEMAQLALDCTQDRVCLFLRLAFLEGKKRSVWLRNSPLARILVLPDRVSCVPGHLLGTPQKNSGSVAYAWFVWEHGHHGRPEIDWLPMEEANDGRE